MKIKVSSKEAMKGLQRKQKKFGARLLKEIYFEAEKQTGNMKTPVVTGRLIGSYTARLFPGRMVRMGSGANKNKPVQYASWIETGKRKNAKRIGNRKYKYYFGKGSQPRNVTSAPRNVGLWEFKKAKTKVASAIPKLARKININKL